jgi:hypothetical protein
MNLTEYIPTLSQLEHLHRLLHQEYLLAVMSILVHAMPTLIMMVWKKKAVIQRKM